MPHHVGRSKRQNDSDSSDDDSSVSSDDDSFDSLDGYDSFDSDDSEVEAVVEGFVELTLNHQEPNDGCASCSSSDDDADSAVIALILTPQQMLLKGLAFAGFTPSQIAECSDKTNSIRFLDQYGASHIVYAHLWEDLLSTDDEDAVVPPEKAKIEHFLMSVYFLKKHPTEIDRESKFHFSHATIAKWTWYYLEKIQAMKAAKIVWDEGREDDIWALTVDGTHCWTNEPKHPTLSQDSACYSHKYNKAGIDYEFGISLSTNKLVWMSGPHPAGDCSDKTVFTLTDGLRDKLKAAKKRGIGDRGYVGCEELSTPNAHDEKVVRKFKSRALARHENFNGMTKRFRCIDGRFRHSLPKFATCFEATCVICQCQLELGNPLYDILTPSMM